MIQAYPTMDVEVAAIAAMEGVKADDQLALDLANAMHSLAVKKNTKNHRFTKNGNRIRFSR